MELSDATEKKLRKLNLKSLDLKVTYRSVNNDILNEFYIPCLEQSICYKRAVGYFTSASLSESARGLVEFVKNGGTMQLIASPKLTHEDIEKIKKGYELKEIISKSLISGIENKGNEIDIIRIKNLTWMIANNRLDIKIAFPDSISNELFYHEKIGIFIDATEEKNMVAFSGSLNETYDGLISNYESIDVSISWSEGIRERIRVSLHNKHFDDMWDGKALGLKIIEFPEVVKKNLFDLYKPELSLIEPSKKRVLYYFQKEAVSSWINANYKGILSMATGSGKTYTALKALEYVKNNKLSLIIVPSLDLIDQWEKEILSEYNNCVIRKASSKHKNWRNKVLTMIKAIKYSNHLDRNFIITTINTASRKPFQNLIKQLSNNEFSIVIDEVHHSGAPKFKSVFNINSDYCIGLSATPERQWDEEGNQAIFNYFGPSVYEYTIPQAIKDDKLTEYFYYIETISLNEYEKNEFKKINVGIITTLNEIRSKYPIVQTFSIPRTLDYLTNVDEKTANKLRSLYLRRADIVKRAENKANALKKIIKNNELKKCLVYCNDLEHIDESLAIIHDEGYIPIEFSSRISSEDREKILSQFEKSIDQNIFLVAVRCLDEGIDLPSCNSAILISSSRSTREFIQRRGRVLRKHHTKKNSTIFDIVVLPFINENDAYPLNKGEFGFIEEELKRVKIFSENALNIHNINIEKMLNLYKRYLLE